MGVTLDAGVFLLATSTANHIIAGTQGKRWRRSCKGKREASCGTCSTAPHEVVYLHSTYFFFPASGGDVAILKMLKKDEEVMPPRENCSLPPPPEHICRRSTFKRRRGSDGIGVQLLRAALKRQHRFFCFFFIPPTFIFSTWPVTILSAEATSPASLALARHQPKRCASKSANLSNSYL